MGFHENEKFLDEQFGINEYDLKTLRIINYRFNELMYLCDNFDINKINNLLINIIENSDFLINDDEKGEFSKNYSDMRDAYKLSEKIIASEEYINMIDYMNYNFELIYEKYDKYEKKIQGFVKKYLKYIETTKNDVDTVEKIKAEYKIVISNLEEIQQRFTEIHNNINADIITIEGIKINVVLITNSAIIYNIINYWPLKGFLYKNLHIINSDAYQITNSDIIEFKNKFYKIYKNVHEDFINKYKIGDAKKFNETFINEIKGNIQTFRDNSKKAEEVAVTNLKETKKKEKEEEEEKIKKKSNEEDAKISIAKLAELEAETAKNNYDAQLHNVNMLKKALAELEGSTIMINDEDADAKKTTKTDDDKGNANAKEANGKEDNGKDGNDKAGDNDVADALAVGPGVASGNDGPGAAPALGNDGPTDAPPTRAIPATPAASTAASAAAGAAGAAVATSAVSSEPGPAATTSASETDPMSRVSYLYLLKLNSKTGLEKGNIPDRIWIIILLNEGWKGNRDKKYNTDKFDWKDIINKWHIKSNQKNTIGETEKRAYWDNAAKGKIRFSSEYYPIKPVAELQEILLIGEKPSDWTGYKSEKILEKARNDEWMVFHLNKYQEDFLRDAAEKYFKDHHGATDMMKYGYPSVVEEKDFNIEKYGDQRVSVHGDIKEEFMTKDKYKKNILQDFKFETSGPYYYLQDNFEKREDLNRESERRRYYLTKEQMKFYDDYYDYYQNFSNLNESTAKIIKNKTLFILPQPNDRDIEEFKRVDRFLSAIYNDLIANRKTKNEDRNIIILPISDERIYLKYISFFNEHYKDPILTVKENLIFIGNRYELKTKADLDLYLKTL
jgi:hypothetical protein